MVRQDLETGRDRVGEMNKRAGDLWVRKRNHPWAVAARQDVAGREMIIGEKSAIISMAKA